MQTNATVHISKSINQNKIFRLKKKIISILKTSSSISIYLNFFINYKL